MAKILAKILPSPYAKLAKVRKNYQWTKAEIDSLPEIYENKKRQSLEKLEIKFNKQLEKAAFNACDKGQYIDCENSQKLQAFDVKQYMQYRAANHAAAKAIFKAIKAGTDYKDVFVKHSADISKLKENRKAFISELENKKAAFIANNPTSDGSEYAKLKSSLDQEYKAAENALTVKFQKEIEEKTAKLNQKLQQYSAQIESLKAAAVQNNELPENVLLSVKGLKMYFGGLKAVDDLTFDVKKGEIFGLIGPNGAGKTTVFNCITRFYDATGGDMYFENKQGEIIDLRDFKVHDVILQGISRTFQNVELVKEVSVLDNLLVACTRDYRTGLFGQMLGLPSLKKEDKILRAKAMKILKFMGIESYSAWYAMGLPYGILKKVEIARALMSDAKLIIMDEPAAGLNDTETAELAQTIMRIRDEFNVTILLVEHDMSLVMNVCDTICAISFGKMLAIGNAEYIKNDKAVQEAYLGVEEDEDE